MEIVKAPHPVLSQKARHVTQINSNIIMLIANMKKALLAARDPEGVGLAAPQVGKSLQIFIVKQNASTPITVYINPRIDLIDRHDIPQQKDSEQKSTHKLEGCLSLQNIWGTVNRAAKVHITYQDEEGNQHSKSCTGFLATIIQHEYDHLQGILFPKRVLEQHGKLYKSKKDNNGDDEFHELAI